jgi:hypothetical protein
MRRNRSLGQGHSQKPSKLHSRWPKVAQNGPQWASGVKFSGNARLAGRGGRQSSRIDQVGNAVEVGREGGPPAKFGVCLRGRHPTGALAGRVSGRAAASASAVARPMPLDAPVIITAPRGRRSDVSACSIVIGGSSSAALTLVPLLFMPMTLGIRPAGAICQPTGLPSVKRRSVASGQRRHGTARIWCRLRPVGG